MINHEFTPQIMEVLTASFGRDATDIMQLSPLLQYINIKTRSANRGSKSRGSFANLYAIYVLVEDYLKNGYHNRPDYKDYDGARFSELFRRQRELPFGSKLQNHALNSRMNEEFKKFFPEVEYIPILRNVTNNRYWINENLLKVNGVNIAREIITIIDRYVQTKRDAFETFIETCEKLKEIDKEKDKDVSAFILSLVAPNSDARVFEIVSFSILRFYYFNQNIYFGFDPTVLTKENLKLYKTGRTNANDGGIDFVMRPLGRFFQVTETLDVRKYFLDIDKIERYPISFVIKSLESEDVLTQRLWEGATRQFNVRAIVDKYMACIEEIVNIPILIERFHEAEKNGYLRDILDEIINQSKVEFNYEEIIEGLIDENGVDTAVNDEE